MLSENKGVRLRLPISSCLTVLNGLSDVSREILIEFCARKFHRLHKFVTRFFSHLNSFRNRKHGCGCFQSLIPINMMLKNVFKKNAK